MPSCEGLKNTEDRPLMGRRFAGYQRGHITLKMVGVCENTSTEAAVSAMPSFRSATRMA
jgi:hypothetical protein